VILGPSLFMKWFFLIVSNKCALKLEWGQLVTIKEIAIFLVM
jgi:hypothetical protein